MKLKLYLQFIVLLFSVPIFSYGETEEEIINAYQTAQNLFVLNNGQVMACGKNGYGQLGRPVSSFETTPDLVTGLTDVVSAKEGNEFSLALKRDGTVWSWGRNNLGQLGGTGPDRYIPQQISGLSCVVEISAGPDYAMALLSDGTVKTWGHNSHYQLGYTTPGALFSSTPALIPGVSQVKKIVCGWASSYAILANGRVMAWGRNANGLLGRGNQTSKELPDEIPDLFNVKDISGGINHCIALSTDQTIRVWGSNAEGQLGLGSSVSASYDPLPLTTLAITNNVSKIAALRDANLILLTGGSVMSWGKNHDGEAVVCTAGINYTPVTVTTGLTGIIDLKGNGYNSLIILNGGQYRIYGENASGQLGQGNFDPNIHCNGVVPIGVPIIKTGRGLTFSDIADAGADISFCGQVPAVIQLGTNYCRNHIATYSWEPMIGLNSYTIANPLIVSPQNLPFGPTTYTLTMTVDGVSTTDQVTVNRLPDMATGAKIGEDVVEVCSGTPTVINPLYEITGGSTPYTYTWTASSSTPGAPISALSSTTVPNPTFTYNVEGTYTYKVTVSSAPGCETFYEQSIYVRKSAQTVADFPTNVFCDYNNTGASLITTNLPSYTYLWTVNNGYTSNTFTASPDFSSGGTYDVTLTVTDPCGNSATVTKQMVFNPSTTNYNPSCCEASVTYTTGLNGDYTVNASNTVAGILTWNTNKVIRGTVYIEKGYTLKMVGTPTVPTTVRFGMDGRIVVKPGGRLEITNAIVGGLDNIVVGMTCKTMWQGIEVWGNPAYVQTGLGANEQGKLTVSGTSQIIDAHKAIFVGQRNRSYASVEGEGAYVEYVDGFGGGIINVVGCTFNKNGIDIQFAPYTPPSVATNPCIIKGNIFNGGQLLDPGYNTANSVNAPAYPNQNNRYYAPSNNLGRTPKHIRMYKVSGLNIQDNIFDNAEYGIDAVDAQFDVTKATAANGNDFKNLTNGIYITHTTSGVTYPHIISNNKFNKIKGISVTISGGGGDLMSNNTFGESSTLPPSTQADNPQAIYLNNTSNFNVVDNTFFRIGVGVYILNSGSAGGMITSGTASTTNNFVRCKQGVQTSGNNLNLQIHCATNTYLNETSGEYGNKNWNIAGTLANQGASTTTDGTKPAGNEFDPPARKDIFSSYKFRYYRHSQSATGTASVLPTIAVGSVMNAFDITNTGVPKDASSCSPTPPCAPNCDGLMADNTEKLSMLESEYDLMLSSMEGVNTSLILSDLQDPSLSSEQLKNSLLAYSPLSDLVMASLIENYYKLTQSHFVEVLEQNLPMQSELWEMIQEILPEYTPAYQEYIVAKQQNNQEHVTLTSLERLYEKASNERQALLASMVYDEQKNNPEAATAILLTEENENKQTAIGTLLAQEDYTEAQGHLSAVSTDNQDDADWAMLTQLHIDLLSAGKTWFDISSSQEQTLRNITAHTGTKASAQAWAVLHLVFNEEIPVVEQVHSPVISARKKPLKHNLKPLTENRLMEAYPNPATDVINIPYYATEEVVVEVVDLLGKTIYTESLQKGYQLLRINVSAMNTGMYMAIMRDKYGNQQSAIKINVQ